MTETNPYLDEFLTESKEHLDSIEEDLLLLEKKKDNPDSKLVDKVFRAIHTLKSSAGCLGYKKISDLSHSMESLLSLLRNGKIKAEMEYINAVLEGVDVVKSMLEDIDRSETYDTSLLLKRLGDYSTQGMKSPVGPAEAPTAGPTSKAAARKSGAGKKSSPQPGMPSFASEEYYRELEASQAGYYDFIHDAQDVVVKIETIRPLISEFVTRQTKETWLSPTDQENIQELIEKLREPTEFFGLFKLGSLLEGLSDLLQLGREKQETNILTNSLVKTVCEGIQRILADLNRGNEQNLESVLTAISTAKKSLSIRAAGEPHQETNPQAVARVPKVLSSPAVSFSDNLVGEFVVECRENIRAVEDGFMALETQTGEMRRETIDSIFRGIHTIKGASTLLGFGQVKELAHIMESVLALVREGKVEPDAKTLSTLMEGLDLISAMVEDIEHSDRFNIKECKGRLETLLALKPSAANPPSGKPAGALSEERTPDPEPSSPLKEAEEDPDSPRVLSVRGKKSAVAKPEASVAMKVDRKETIRISVDILDKLMVLASELVLVRNQHLFSVDKSDPTARSIVQRLDIVTSEMQELIMATRMQPIGNVFGKLPRLVRDLAIKLGKQIELVVTGSEVELDKTILEALADPLTHLLRNSCDHGIEPPQQRLEKGKPAAGKILLRAFHEGGQINIVIKDDGRGIDPETVRRKALEKGLKTSHELAQLSERELLSMICLPGFSTAAAVSEVSGRGVGLDVVKANIDKLGGILDFESQKNEGSTFLMRLPLTLAIIPCLIVMSGEHRYAVPQFNLVELVSLFDQDVFTKIEYAGDKEVYRLRDQLLPLVRFSEVLARSEPFSEKTRAEVSEKYRREKENALDAFKRSRNETESDDLGPNSSLVFAVLKVGASRFGLLVDKIIGTEEIVVRPMHPALKSCSCYSGATIMGDGKVALILDVEGIAQHAGLATGKDEETHYPASESSGDGSQRILLFKVGEKEQFGVEIQLLKRIEPISLSRIDRVGTREFVTINGVSHFVLRLDSVMNVSPCVMNQEMFLFLPKYCEHPFGILFSSLIDIVHTSFSLTSDNVIGEGLLGTTNMNGQLTLFVDIFRLIELAVPEWFLERRKKFPPPEKKQVLLVEDVSFFRQLVKSYLEADGYEVLTAENGLVGLERLRENRVDLIVSDIEMPVLNGWEFIKNIRGWPKVAGLPVIVLTSCDSDEDREKAYQHGFDAFEPKVNREGFLKTVASLLNRTKENPTEENIHGK